MALLNKCLIKIIDFIILNSSQFYAPFALLADPVDGPIFSSLLIGPCALEYTQMKSCEHLWNDPNADELIQRHKMHSSGNLFSSNQMLGNYSPIPVYNSSTSSLSSSNYMANSVPKFKLGLNASIAKRKASISTVLEDISNTSFGSGTNGPVSDGNSLKTTSNLANTTSNHIYKESQNNLGPLPLSPINAIPSPTLSTSPNNSAKEYVESLHQNSKSQLIYGKNYVIVNQVIKNLGILLSNKFYFKNNQKREKEFAGYLSLHLNYNGLVLKWTPNQIMNGSASFDEATHLMSKTKRYFFIKKT